MRSIDETGSFDDCNFDKETKKLLRKIGDNSYAIEKMAYIDGEHKQIKRRQDELSQAIDKISLRIEASDHAHKEALNHAREADKRTNELKISNEIKNLTLKLQAQHNEQYQALKDLISSIGIKFLIWSSLALFTIATSLVVYVYKNSKIQIDQNRTELQQQYKSKQYD